MPYCPNCGSANPDNSAFCRNCGASLMPARQQPAQPAYQQPAQPAYQQPAQPAYQQPAQPVYQQPAQPVYQQPVQAGYQQPAYDPNGYGYAPAPAAPAPKKSKKGLWIGLGCGSVGLVAVVVAVLLLFTGGPMSKLAKAAARTTGALSAQFDSMPNLKLVTDNQQAIAESKALSTNMTVDVAVDGVSVSANAEFGIDYNAKILAGSGSIGIPNVGALRANLSLTNDDFRFSANQLLGDLVLRAGLDDLSETIYGTRGQIPDLFAQEAGPSPFDNLSTVCGESWSAYLNSFEAEESGKGTVEGQVWTTYTLKADPAKKAALLADLKTYLTTDELILTQAGMIYAAGTDYWATGMDELIGELDKLSDPVVAVNEQGYLCSFTMTDSSGSTVSLRLMGGENPWSDVRLYIDNEKILSLSIVGEGGTVSMQMGIFEGGYELGRLALGYSDGNGAFTFTMTVDDESVGFTGHIQPTDKGVHTDLALDLSQLLAADPYYAPTFSASVSMDVMPLTTSLQVLNGTMIDLANASDADWELIDERLMAAEQDPELAALMELIFTTM